MFTFPNRIFIDHNKQIAIPEAAPCSDVGAGAGDVAPSDLAAIDSESDVVVAAFSDGVVSAGFCGVGVKAEVGRGG